MNTLVDNEGQVRFEFADGALEDLSPFDTCDAERGTVTQARVRVLRAADGRVLVLDFCKHHFEVHELSLIASGFEVIDDRRMDLFKAEEVKE